MSTTRDAGDALHQLLEQITMTVVRTLPPDGIGQDQAINDLLMLVDGPLQRLAMAAWEAERVKL